MTGALFGAAALGLGTIFMLLAAVGALRLPDLFTRMHAITKGGTAGVGFAMVAVIAFDPSPDVVLRAVGVMVFVAMTAPISAHVLGRAAYRMRVPMWKGTFADEMGGHREERSTSGDDDGRSSR